MPAIKKNVLERSADSLVCMNAASAKKRSGFFMFEEINAPFAPRKARRIQARLSALRSETFLNNKPAIAAFFSKNLLKVKSAFSPFFFFLIILFRPNKFK